MGSSGSKLSAQVQAQQEEQYAIQMKNSVVVAAMEALEIEKATVGFKFYRLFATMDTDSSKSIDLEEFHQFFELPHTQFSDLVFSNLGKQTPARGVEFDDFVLNLWNFCTMSSQDIYAHVFRLYDDDYNGTLDVAECNSLFRLLYHTENIPRVVKNQLKSMTSNCDGVITLDAFLTMCTSKKSLSKPIFDLQARARTRSLGEKYWSSVSKKRANRLKMGASGHKLSFSPDSFTRGPSNPASSVKGHHTTNSIESKRPNRKEDTPVKAQDAETKALDAWAKAESQKEPLVQAYLAAFSQVYVAESSLKEQKTSAGPGQDELLLDLRYSVAVSTKRRDEARSALEELWEQEQSSLMSQRHEVVTTLVKSISTKTLLKETGKKSSEKVVRSYTQKRLDIEGSDIRGRFTDRWQKLESAAELQAQRYLDASRTTSTSSTKVLLHQKQKSTNGVNQAPGNTY